MEFTGYLIKELQYKSNTKDDLNLKTIRQEMQINATAYKNKKLIEVKFFIIGKDTEEKNVFNLRIFYNIELKEEIKEDSRDEMENIIKNFYPNVKKFLENFYNNEAGLEGLEPPKF